MKKLQKRKLWAILKANGRLSTVIDDDKRELGKGCFPGETVVRVEIREIRK